MHGTGEARTYPLSLRAQLQAWSHSTCEAPGLAAPLELYVHTALTLLKNSVVGQGHITPGSSILYLLLVPPMALLALLITHQFASECRPCTPRAAGQGDREWPGEQHWVGAGGEGEGRAEESEWSAHRSRTRAHPHDQCSPQKYQHPHHRGTAKAERINSNYHQ